MHGYPQFSFWIPKALAIRSAFPHSHKPRKNTLVLVVTTHREPEYLQMRRTYAQ